MDTGSFTRRQFVGAGIAAATGALASRVVGTRVNAAPAGFPKGFLWGVATAAHQVEGNNINSDLWALEHLKPSVYPEPSGDACDHYTAIATTSSWSPTSDSIPIASRSSARIEPEEGFFSNAELEHYRRMLATCREHGLTPVVTFWHFTAPRWFAARGGWESPDAGDLFVRYCERASKHLGDLIGIAATFNEPNIGLLIRW